MLKKYNGKVMTLLIGLMVSCYAAEDPDQAARAAANNAFYMAAFAGNQAEMNSLAPGADVDTVMGWLLGNNLPNSRTSLSYLLSTHRGHLTPNDVSDYFSRQTNLDSLVFVVSLHTFGAPLPNQDSVNNAYANALAAGMNDSVAWLTSSAPGFPQPVLNEATMDKAFYDAVATHHNVPAAQHLLTGFALQPSVRVITRLAKITRDDVIPVMNDLMASFNDEQRTVIVSARQ